MDLVDRCVMATPGEQSFEEIVSAYYEALYRFGLSLSQRSAEASDLVQQTFFLWASKGHQLRDKTKVKSWLFTTLHREFLGSRRRQTRFPHYEVSLVEHSLPNLDPNVVNHVDGADVVALIGEIEEVYREPLVLFYLQELSYQEMADTLEIPIGTVMSRLSRGKAQLRKRLEISVEKKDSKVVKLG